MSKLEVEQVTGVSRLSKVADEIFTSRLDTAALSPLPALRTIILGPVRRLSRVCPAPRLGKLGLTLASPGNLTVRWAR
jgi:hypothetical protein